MQHLAHIARRKDQLLYSGYLAAGDARHMPYAYVVDVGRPFSIGGEDGLLYFKVGVRKPSYHEFSPAGLVIAARAGWYGLQLVELHQPPPEPERVPWPQSERLTLVPEAPCEW